MRRAATIVMIVAVLAGAGAAFGQSRTFVVVGHPGTTPDTISNRDLSRIFLKYRTKWPDGRSAEPVDLKGSSSVRTAFCESVLDKSVSLVDSHWQAQVFSGKNTPPASFATDAEVRDYVRRTPGAVGYVSASSPTEGLTVISLVD